MAKSKLIAGDINPLGVIARGSQLTGKPIDEFLLHLAHNATDLPLDIQAKEIVRFLPPQLVSGHKGIFQSDVLVLSKMPGQYETNAQVLHIGDLGKLWQTYIKNKGVDPSNWLIHNVVPFRLPDHLKGKGQLKQEYVMEGLPILKLILEKANPKYVLLFGAESHKALNKLLKTSKATKENFTDCRGTVLEYDNGIKAVCCIDPNSVLKDPATTDQFQNDLDIFINLIKGTPTHTRPAPVYDVIDTLVGLEVFVNNQLELNKHKPFGRYAIDLEWGANETIRTIQLGWAPNTATVLNLHNPNLVPTELGSNMQKMFKILSPLLQGDVSIEGHNVRGDIKVLRKYGFDLMPQFIKRGFDTMLAYHQIPGNETLEKQLEIVAIRILKVDRYDKPLRDWLKANNIGEETLSKIAYGTVPNDILFPYGAMDAICTYELRDILTAELQKYPEAYGLYTNLIVPLNLAILEMEETGVYVDQPSLITLTDLFRARVNEMLKELQKEVKWEDKTIIVNKKQGRGKNAVTVYTPEQVGGFNPDSVDQVREVLFGVFKVKNGQVTRQAPADAVILDLEPVKATDDKPWEEVIGEGKTHVYNPSTDAESLGILAAENQFAKRLQQYKFTNQIVKNYLHDYYRNPDGTISWTGGIGGSLGSDGRLHTSFRITLETGRYSTSPNCQIWPKKQEKELIKIFTKEGKLDPRYRTVKSVIRASPGYVLIEADWNQAELWTLGYIAPDPKFIHVLQTSDVHTETTKKLFGQLEYKQRRIADIPAKEYNKLRKEDKYLDSLRTAGKSVVFGIPYMRGAKAIAREVSREGLKCTAEEAKKWINDFYTEFKDIAAYINRCKEAVLDPGYIINPYGRYRTSGIADLIPSNDIVAGMQREFVNFRIQSTVADAMSAALCNFYAYRDVDNKIDYRILLSIHDALLFEVKATDVMKFITEVLPLCMERGLEVPKIGLHYTLGDPDIYTVWGEHPDPEQLEDIGVDKFIVDKYVRKAA